MLELVPFTNKMYLNTYCYKRHSEVWFLGGITRIVGLLQVLSLDEHRFKEFLYVIWFQCYTKKE